MKNIIVSAAVSALISIMTVTIVLPMAVDAYMKRKAEAAMQFLLQHPPRGLLRKNEDQ